MNDEARLHLRLRHEPGAVARLASLLNPFHVTELHYAVGDDGTANAMVSLAASPAVRARVAERLRRIVNVLEVRLGEGPVSSVSSVESVSSRDTDDSVPEVLMSPLRSICV
ncbi:MAG TPA: hypothetical protein VLB03_08305 [Nocardioidaceae bacterium]|nr:hypothetical protein [Nocardioidaceae bacterium]